MGRNSRFSREEKIAALKLVTDDGRSALSVANGMFTAKALRCPRSGKGRCDGIHNIQ